MNFRQTLSIVAALTVSVSPLAAQRKWHGFGEASASLIQGNTDQRSLLTKGELSHADSSFELRASLSYVYSDASRDTLPRRMERRTWMGAMAFDYKSHGTVSPFAFVSYESSYEKRVLDRAGFGVGGKVTFIRNSATTASVSLAVLEERLRPSRRSPDTTIVTTARWSGRFRLKHAFDSHVSLSHTTFYQPRLTQASSYTVTSSSEITYVVAKATSLKISYLDLYDSDARKRGARKNNDGTLLFGVRADF